MSRHAPQLRLVDYRGPGGTDALLSPLICDGDDATEWLVKGLTKTAHGAPFGFVFEFADGGEHDLVGLKVLSAGRVPGQRVNAFEVLVAPEDDDNYSEVHYKGTQPDESTEQSHVFDRPVRVRRFLVRLHTNHGDADNAQANELMPILDTASSSGPDAGAGQVGIAFADPAPADPDYAGEFPYDLLSLPEVPGADDPSSAGPVDRFLLAALKEEGLGFSPLAPREVLLRRVTYDLTGLPSTPEEIDAFLGDRDADAYEKAVDRLLASPRFGERWAQHWLDLVLYADTDGYTFNGVRKSAWRYRDYVIRAFNEDLPFDRFVIDQLAADGRDRPRLEDLPALGFLRMGPFRINSGNQNIERNRQELLTSMTDVVGSAFLAMTVGCARCHDHKIDPIPQSDYYRLQAYFASTEPASLPMVASREVDDWGRKSSEVTAGLASLDVRRAALFAGARRRALERKLQGFPMETRVAVLTMPEMRDSAQSTLAMAVEGKVMPLDEEVKGSLLPEEREELESIEREQDGLKKSLPPPLPEAWGLQDRGGFTPATYVYHRGQVAQKKSRVGARVPSILPHADSSVPPDRDDQGVGRETGSRMALARWLVAEGRSRTARVIVNRLWQHHFGRGIIGTPNDFGNMGEPPSHPELLDWLANDLIDGGWKLKRLHRQLVLSRAYQQASTPRAEGVTADPSNSLYWRANARRLSAEEIRDSLLSFSGRLNPEMGGPGAVLPLPPEVLKDLKKYKVTPDETQHRRRSIYLFVERNFRMPMLEAFDQPDTMTSCPQRGQSTHALQSLSMLNNEWTVSQAEAIAGRMRALSAPSEKDRIAAAYRLISSRLPTPAEVDIAEEYLRGRSDELAGGGKPEEAWGDLCLVLLNLNRFLYVD